MANHHLDQLRITNPTNEPFSVKWNGQPYTLMPGQQIIWMRFLAEHFAKHLADAILLKKEAEHKAAYLASGQSLSDYIPVSYVNDKTMRPQVINSIILGVYQYHQPNVQDQAAMIQQQIDAMNQPQEKVLDLGDGIDPLMGMLQDHEPDTQIPQQPVMQPPQPVQQPDLASAQQLIDAPTPEPTQTADATIHELRAEARKLGIKVENTDTKDILRQKIQAQYA